MTKQGKRHLLAALIVSLVAMMILAACATNPVKINLYFRVDGEIYATIGTSGRDSITIPEDPKKEGYDFDGWYFDEGTWEKPFTANSLLNAPLTSNLSVYAKFVKKNDSSSELPDPEPSVKEAKYIVQYYLQNIENDDYSLKETSEFSAPAGQDVNAEIKEFEHFTYSHGTINGVVYDDGSLVLELYYTRNTFTVTFNANGGKLVSGQETQQVKYLGSAVAPTYTREGYKFVGFDVDYAKIVAATVINAQWGDIEKQNYDMSKVVFRDKTVTYDGNIHTIVATNLPDGVSVVYENNEHIDAGTYIITAKFSGDTVNYNPIPNKTAVLTIDKATINTDNIIFMDKTVEYNGESRTITAQNLPAELDESDISYVYFKEGSLVDEAVEAGVYTVFLTFNLSPNYNTLPNMKAILTITRTSYEEKYQQYGVLGKTIDLINASEITTVSGGKQVFNKNLFYNDIYREEIGKQNGTSKSSSSIVESLDNHNAAVSLKVAFGSRQDKNGKFMTNRFPSISVDASGSYQRKKKSETDQYSYTYSYNMNGYRVDIQGYTDPTKFSNILSDELLNDALKIRNGTLSPQAFVKMWGTHVIMSAIFGEQVDVVYTAMKTTDEDSMEWKAKLDAAFEARFLKTGLKIEGAVEAGKIETSNDTNSISDLSIKVTSKKLLSSTSLDDFSSAYAKWIEAHTGEDCTIFTDLPDGSLYCIWYLLGDEYQDVINVLDDYMYDNCSELYNQKVSAINSLMFNDDIEFDKATGCLTLDLSNYQERGSASDFGGTAFSGVYNITPYYNGMPIQSIKIKGAYKTKNSKGQNIESFIDSFALSFDKDWENDIDITLENVGMKTPLNAGFIDLSNITKKVKLTINYIGSNVIYAKDGIGKSTIIANDITIKSTDSSASLEIKGSKGKNGTTAGEKGANGEAAINAKIITIDAIGKLMVIGGDGGTGAVGVKGTDYTGSTAGKDKNGNGKKGKDGGAGGKGGSGGNGASAIVATTINANTVFICQSGNGGNGGIGGNGGNGQNGGHGKDGSGMGTSANGKDGGVGGAGGVGGNGGDKGHSVKAVEALELINQENITQITGDDGVCGNGGNGGNGGRGGNGGSWQGAWGDAGQAGNGGVGGAGGAGYKGGNGGNGGRGGNKGDTWYNSRQYATGGNGGAAGVGEIENGTVGSKGNNGGNKGS